MEESLLFTMTIRVIDRGTMAEGRSLNGETWEQTLLRLYHEALPRHSPQRRISYTKRHAGQAGVGTNAVIMSFRNESGFEVSDDTLFINTVPPQF